MTGKGDEFLPYKLDAVLQQLGVGHCRRCFLVDRIALREVFTGQDLVSPILTERAVEFEREGFTLIQRAIAKTPGCERERLEERLYESQRLNGYTFFVQDTPLDEVITRICRDLGLDPDWTALSEVDWRLASRETRAALTHPPPDIEQTSLAQADAYFPPPQEMAADAPSRRSTGPPSTWMG